MFDPRLGGFGGAPKFPRPSIHNFLLRYYAETGNEEALEMVLTTLREMAKGGMNDQIGGGFHRYSVDERWFVPHFEKMLYDQAQLAVSYLEAFQITRDGQYAAAARDIFTYVLRDMTDPGGGFYSAEDADSASDPAHPHEKGEGAFYVWRKQEIEDALEPGAAAMFCYRYGVEANGNVEEDPHGEFRGANILYQAHTIEETAAHTGVTTEEVRAELQRASAKLLEIRARRPRPLRDDKVLAAWNGMMISAFAKGAQILNDARYAQAARAAADFLRRHLWDDGRQILQRRYRGGESAIDGFLDDYAFCGLALLDLYETTFEARDFEWAVRLAERAIELFEDAENGGFFSTAAGAPDALAAPERRLRRRRAFRQLRHGAAAAAPRAHDGSRRFSHGRRTHFARLRIAHGRIGNRCAADAGGALLRSGPSPGNCAGRAAQRSRMLDMLASIRRRFLPGAVVMRSEQSSLPMPALDGAPTAYVCENFACKLPVTNASALDELLE